MSNPTGNTVRPLHIIAAEIRQTWPNVYFGAVPYLDALSTIDAITDAFYAEDGKTQVAYFLANAGTWRGPDAKRIKNELRAMVGLKPSR